MTIFHDALNTLKPNANWVINGNDTYANITWIDTEQTKPTESAVTTKVNELQAAYNAQAYARNRAAEYPSIADQLDDIYHNGIDAWKATIKTTKDKYPKP
jgi:hypothetical protein